MQNSVKSSDKKVKYPKDKDVVRDAMGRALDLRSTGHGFKSYSGQMLHNNLGQVVHIYVPLSSSSITLYRPRDVDAMRLGR